MGELKPCPWCGETPATETEVGSTHRWRRVVGCCTPGPEVRHNPDLTYQQNHEAAIAAWNTRPAPSEAEVEAAAKRVWEVAPNFFAWHIASDCVRNKYLRMARAALGVEP